MLFSTIRSSIRYVHLKISDKSKFSAPIRHISVNFREILSQILLSANHCFLHLESPKPLPNIFYFKQLSPSFTSPPSPDTLSMDTSDSDTLITLPLLCWSSIFISPFILFFFHLIFFFIVKLSYLP